MSVVQYNDGATVDERYDALVMHDGTELAIVDREQTTAWLQSDTVLEVRR